MAEAMEFEKRYNTFLIIVLVCIFDFGKVTQFYNDFIAWVRIKPYQAIGVIIVIYTVSIVFTLPTTCWHIMLGYTYS